MADEVSLSKRPIGSLAEKLGFAKQKFPKKSRTESPKPAHSQQQLFKLSKALCGHKGWVNAVAIDAENTWFATASTDNTIKIWDLASGRGKLTLTGHSMPVQSLAISDRMPYMFSGGMDRSLKCWDLESNSVVRSYHGHQTAIQTVELHPTLNLVSTGCRDGSIHVWDIRSRKQVYRLKGHTGIVNKVKCRATDPQLISASGDASIRFWDLRTGRTVHGLTSHSGSVGAIEVTSNDTLLSASKDSIRKWSLPLGTELVAVDSSSYANSISISPTETLLATAKSDGTISIADTSLGVLQTLTSPLLPGSIESESPVLCCTFDRSGSRLITGHSDKSVRIWAENT